MRTVISSVSAEDVYIRECIISLLKENPELDCLDDKELTLQLEERGFFALFHSSYLLNIIYSYLYNNCGDIAKSIFETCFILPNDFKPSLITCNHNEDICQLCESSHIAFLNSKFNFRRGSISRVSSKHNLIDKGAVYTQPAIVSKIVSEACCNAVVSQKNYKKFRLLDFACGTGRFYEASMSFLSQNYGISKDDIILNCLYAIDIDSDAINITRLKAIANLDTIDIKKAGIISQHILQRNGLIHEGLYSDDLLSISADDCNGLFEEGFDVIVSNPPYLVLKPNNKISDAAWNQLKLQINYFRNCGRYHYSIEGMLNLYQLSIESMIYMLKPSGHLGIICPSTLFADLSASKIRKYLLTNFNVYSIEYFAEKDDLFDNVTQATCIFHLKKDKPSDSIHIISNSDTFNVNLDLVRKLFPSNLEVPNITGIEWEILQKLTRFAKLKDIAHVRNKRGELDLTQYSSFITMDRTPYRLIRGRMLRQEGIVDSCKEYVLESFIDKKSDSYKKYDFGKIRLVCPQISNMSERQRLRFVYCTESDIIGNSCNYLSSDRDTLDKLQLLLNSKLLNWRFKITSSNNHVSNYELSELPIANLDSIDIEKFPKDKNAYNEQICMLYGLSEIETNFICNNENI